MPLLDRNIEAAQPAGPAPEIIISEKSCWNGKGAKKGKKLNVIPGIFMVLNITFGAV